MLTDDQIEQLRELSASSTVTWMDAGGQRHIIRSVPIARLDLDGDGIAVPVAHLDHGHIDLENAEPEAFLIERPLFGTTETRATNPTQPPSDRRAFWTAINDFAHEYVEGYEFRGDTGDYHPSDRERFLLTDCVAGLLHDLGQAQFLATPPETNEHLDDQAVWRDLKIGEKKQPGDRFMSEDHQWVTIKPEHLELFSVVSECTRPTQRRVINKEAAVIRQLRPSL